MHPIRLCIIVGLRCNLHCSYCFERGADACDEEFSPVVFDYISNLRPDDPTKVICISGGEPLLYWENTKHLLTLAPNWLHKKIVSNGTLLTEEIVDFLNEQDIELHLSHDGPRCAVSRGVDIFSDPKLLGLVRKVRNLSICYVINRDTLTGEGFVPWFDNTLGREDWCPLGTLEATCPETSLLPFLIQHKIYVCKHPRNYNFTWYSYGNELHKYPFSICLHPDATWWSMDQKSCYGPLNQSMDEFQYRVEYTPNQNHEYCRRNSSCLVRDTCIRTCTSNALHCAYTALPSMPRTKHIAL